MASNHRAGFICLLAAIGLSALVPGAAVAARVEWSRAVTLETPAGPVTCGLTPPAEPNWAEVLLTATPTRLGAEVLGASPLACETATYGEALLTGAGFPWHLAVNLKSRTATLRGTKKVGLEISLPSVPGAKCLYQASKLTGTLSGESPRVLSLATVSVKLDTARSFALCPAGGSFSGSFTLP